MDETIDIATNIILENYQNIKISRTDLKKLFEFCTSKTHFMFNGNFFDQIDGVAMGSPLAPVLANLFMSFNEKIWIESYEGVKPFFYKRYVDDIFAVFSNEQEATKFFNYINNKHPNIKFTMEKENEQKLAFLDVLIDNSMPNIKTSIFRKKTFTALLTNYLSFTSFSYKCGLIKCLVDRAFKINNTWLGFHIDLTEIKNILKKNAYSDFIVNKIIYTYLNHKVKDVSMERKESLEVRYFKLPYIGNYSYLTKSKINKIIKRYCKSCSVKIIFTSFKIGSMFSSKDKIPNHIKSNVVYQFTCASCNASYIGETTRRFGQRIEEHLKKDKSSYVYKHIHDKVTCFDAADIKSFSILDKADTKWQLKLKEGLHISWKNPVLNRQVKHVNKTLSV